MNKWILGIWGLSSTTIIILFVMLVSNKAKTESKLTALLADKEVPKPIIVEQKPTKTAIQTKVCQINNLLATVQIVADKEGTGTVISYGDKYAAILTSDQLFAHPIKKSFMVKFSDGSYDKATLLVIDRSRGLAMLRVDNNNIKARSYVPADLDTPGIIGGVSYQESPEFRALRYVSGFWNGQHKAMWEMKPKEGSWQSNIGAGIFLDDGLIGVITNMVDPVDNSCYNLTSCSHQEILKFLKENSDLLTDCGSWDQGSQPEVISVMKKSSDIK